MLIEPVERRLIETVLQVLRLVGRDNCWQVPDIPPIEHIEKRVFLILAARLLLHIELADIIEYRQFRAPKLFNDGQLSIEGRSIQRIEEVLRRCEQARYILRTER